MKKLSFLLTLFLLAAAVSIATMHSGEGDARQMTAFYWTVLSVKLMTDMLQKG